LVVAACGADPDEPDRRPAPIQTTPGYEGAPAAWVGDAPAGDPAVATVGGVPIHLTDLKRQMEARPGVPAREVLQALIEGEALAQEAVRQNVNAEERVVERYRESLARAFLDEAFELEVSPASIPMALVKRGYEFSRLQFDRAPAFVMAHMHFVCCYKGKEDCGAPESIECFTLAYPLIGDVYRQAQAALADTFGDPESMEVAMQAFVESARQQFPNLVYQRVPFYYDVNVPHEKQRGRYKLLDERLAKALIAQPLGELTEPIKTDWGWHIASLLARFPEQRRKLTDPGVEQEVRDRAFPAYQRMAFNKRLEELARKYNIQLIHDPLGLLDSYWGYE